MTPLVLDFETYFDRKDYSLSRMTTEAYVRDPRFEPHGCAVKFAGYDSHWVPQEDLRVFFKQVDWNDVYLICHHTHFDGFILQQHFGICPRMVGCTLSMARLVLGNHLSVSLDAVRRHFGIPAKLTPYNLFEGKRWHELTPDVQKLVADGAIDEVESIWKIFNLLLPQVPVEELDVIDSVVSMFTQPVLRADTTLLKNLWEREALRKQNGLDELGVDETELQSADKFAELLREEGIEPECKTSPKGKEIYAFAKTDEFMRQLLEHDNDRVRLLAETRLGVKSTILQTRAETLGWMASRGPLPVYLRYAGAGTLRVSGGDGANWLNFKRGSDIRKSILAPEGYVLAPIDASQIECRVLHYLAGGPDEPVIRRFRNNEDPYVDLASRFYGETIYKPAKDDPRRAEMEAKRGMGKQGRLMCLGADTKVLTDHGVKLIIDVNLKDRLWDGVEWIKHQGLIYQGEQRVVEVKGIKVTSDHRVLCGPDLWCPAAWLQRNDVILSHALALGKASLPFRGLNLVQKEVCSTSSLNARAEHQSIPLTQQIFTQDAAPAVARVLLKHLDIGQKNITDMQTSAPIKSIGRACLDAFRQFLRVVANVLNITRMPTMAGEASGYIVVGEKIEKRFWPIWSRCRDGMIQRFRLIESKIIEAIDRAIYVSPLQNNKPQTVVQCETLNELLPTYDLSFAGPRNRFTILSEAGPLIVHNCGYGAAGDKFKITAKNGLYGPSVDIPLEDAERFVQLYRQDNPSVCARPGGYWSVCEEALKILFTGATFQFGPLVAHMHKLWLPNGAMLNYDSLEWHVPDMDEECRDFERKGYWRMKTRQGWKKMWGSKLTQNICEAVSRVIVSQAMLRIKKMGFRTLNWPYDELLILLPKDGHEEKNLEACMAEMKREVEWLPGLPLDCEGSIGERYSK